MSEIFWESSKASADLNSAFENLITKTELGFWQLPDRDENWRVSASVADEIAHYKRMKVIGQGGSALGGKLLVNSMGVSSRPVEFLNDFEPDVFQSQLESIQSPEDVVWLVISKSGSTLEVLGMLTALLNFYEKKSWDLKSHLIIVTEPSHSVLKTWAMDNAVRTVDHPLDVGGRFAGLTPVGLIPAAFAGLNIDALREGASLAVQSPKHWLRFLSSILESTSGNFLISVFWTYSERLRAFGPWLQQLWSESLGKPGIKSISTPMLSHGSTDQHSLLQQYMEGLNDKNYVILREKALEARGMEISETPFKRNDFLNGKKMGQILYSQSRGTEMALREAGRPVQIVEIPELNENTLGELIMSFELMVGTLGEHLGFDAFTQPGVEAGKKITRNLLS